MDEKELDTMIDAHWQYINGLLELYGTPLDELERAGFMYRTAFKHGFGHALELVTGSTKLKVT